MLKKWIFAAALCVFGWAHAAAVDANKANPTDLDQIKGIGPATAARIVEQRKSAPFKNWDDFIARVNGVGPAKAAKLSEQGLTINGQAYKSAAPSAKTAGNAPASPSKASKPAKGQPAT